MALSMDEQRMLAEIERRLAAEDPGLASCLTTFRRPSPARVLRSPRARIIGSLFTVLLVAVVALMVYAMIPFRAHIARHSPAFMPGGNFTTAEGSGSPGDRDASASGSVGSSTAVIDPNTAAARLRGSTTGMAQEPKSKQTNAPVSPSAKP
jgi:Protein of unknown function (DUF3040)